MTLPRTPSPVLEQVKRLRVAQAAREVAELQRLVDTYAAIDRMARREAEALALAEAEAGALHAGDQIAEMVKLHWGSPLEWRGV